MNKEILLKSGYNRNSFDRFGDDLCEEITQYLSFKDKTRFECVSKQFKRCVYQRQYTLETFGQSLMKCFMGIGLNELDLSRISRSPFSRITTNERIYEIKRALEKCRKISCVKFIDYQTEIANALLMIIASKYQRIVCDNKQPHYYYQLSPNTVREMRLNCNFLHDYSLTDIGFSFGPNYNDLLGLCPNILSLCYVILSELIDVTSDIAFAPKENHITNAIVNYDNESMNCFVTRYSRIVKQFSVNHNRIDNWFDVTSQLSQLNNLEDLSLFVRANHFSMFLSGFENFAEVCGKRVKKLSIYFPTERSNQTYIEILSIINRFTEIISLRISGSNIFDENTSFDSIKNCEQLKRLELYGINSDHFRDIDKYLPKLTAVKILVETHDIISDETLNRLSNLSELRELYFGQRFWNRFSNYGKITSNAILDLLEKCAHFRSLYFNHCPYVNRKLIHNFARIAGSRPHVKFDYCFYNCRQKQTQKFRLVINSINRFKTMPNLPDVQFCTGLSSLSGILEVSSAH